MSLKWHHWGKKKDFSSIISNHTEVLDGWRRFIPSLPEMHDHSSEKCLPPPDSPTRPCQTVLTPASNRKTTLWICQPNREWREAPGHRSPLVLTPPADSQVTDIFLPTHREQTEHRKNDKKREKEKQRRGREDDSNRGRRMKQRRKRIKLIWSGPTFRSRYSRSFFSCT